MNSIPDSHDLLLLRLALQRAVAAAAKASGCAAADIAPWECDDPAVAKAWLEFSASPNVTLLSEWLEVERSSGQPTEWTERALERARGTGS